MSQFQPGQSGNPAGRPAGSRNRKSLVLEEFERAGSEVAAKVVEMAKGGDLQAAALVLQRTDPPARQRAQPVTFDLDPNGSYTDQAKQILVAVSKGEVDPDTGKLLMDLLQSYVALTDVENVLAELNKRRMAKQKQVGQYPGGVKLV